MTDIEWAMNESNEPRHSIVPRQGPDFGLDGDIPKYWFEGNAFKTRYFDAMSTLFPEGEKFFIQCVRDYRDGITDPVMTQEVKDFTYQEGQHSMVHRKFNDRLQRQGVRVDRIEENSRNLLALFRRVLPKTMTLAQTAAVEHFTAIMAHSFVTRPQVFEHADPRLRAMYMWHAIEEIEHKSVAFDVMQKIAGVGYFRRIVMMLWVSFGFPLHVFLIMRHMFRVDGFSFGQRAKLWFKGLWWLYGPGGLIPPLLPSYFAYYRPGFHPWQDGSMDAYANWRRVYDSTGDAVAAGASIAAAG
jgi:hypothetical protein